VGWKIQKRERYALIEQDSENPRKHRGTFYIGPRHVKHHYSKEFVEFSYVTAPNFASEKDCRVFAQNSHVAIEIYDYYAKLFDPDYENVSVYDERFDVQYLFKTKPSEDWRSVDYYNPTIQVIPLEDGVEIKRIFDTDYGTQTLEISHVVRTGALLKHNIKFTNKTADTKTFRVVMKLAGITHNKVRHKAGQLEITQETSIGKHPFFLIGEDNQHLKLSEYLWTLGDEDETGEWSATTLKDIVFDVHAQGCKADIIIGNYTLGENQSLLIDPDSDTWQVNDGDDDAIEYGSGSFDAANDYNRVRSYTSPLSSNYICCGVRFTSITIGQGDTIDSADVLLYTYSGTYDDMNGVVYGNDVDNAKNFAAAPTGNPHIISTEDRPRTDGDGVEGDGSVSWVEDGIGAGVWATKSVRYLIQEIVNRGSWSSGNALVLLFIANTDVYKVFRAKSYENNTTQCPKLEVTWTSGGQTYEINVDAVVKASAEKSLQTTYNIHKDAAVSSQAVEASETTFNIPKDAIVKSLADLGIETTFNISKDALVQTLADVIVEKISAQLIEIFKDAVVQAQATFSLESTFNINKDAISEAAATVGIETIFNVVKDAIVKASATPQVLGIYPINVDAVVKASATASFQQTLGISKDAIVVAVSTPLIQSTFNISPEAVVKVLAEVSVVKEGEVKVKRVFLIVGNIAIQLTGD